MRVVTLIALEVERLLCRTHHTEGLALPGDNASVDRIHRKHVHQRVRSLETCPQLPKEITKSASDDYVCGDARRKR